MNFVKIFRNNNQGAIKPMHCTNNIPSYHQDNLTDMFKDVVPYVRLHDSAFLYPYERFVDVPYIFKDFSADVNRPNSYDFTFTDDLMKKIISRGIKPFFRLGVSIENFQSIKAFHINVPADFKKWAIICENIIRHYNEGWADGMFLDIMYWEIWNEPDNFPEISDNQMWKGTFDKYIELYITSANHLKKCFPNIKIGGYSSCGFYQIFEQASVKEAKISSRTEYFLECANKFLQTISSEKSTAPLDFFSWHSYSPLSANKGYADYARNLLNKYGFFSTESILNEWNPGIHLRGSLVDAANIVTNMIELQKSSLDMLMYYDARIESPYCGLFSPVGDFPHAHEGKALKAYYVFKAFNELYKLGNQIETEIVGENIFALSARSVEDFATIICNNQNVKAEIKLKNFENIKYGIIISKDKNYQQFIVEDYTLNLNAFEIVLIKY